MLLALPHFLNDLEEIPLGLPLQDYRHMQLEIVWFSIKTSLHLRNGTRQGYSYCGRLIESRMRSAEWC